MYAGEVCESASGPTAAIRTPRTSACAAPCWVGPAGKVCGGILDTTKARGESTVWRPRANRPTCASNE